MLEPVYPLPCGTSPPSLQNAQIGIISSMQFSHFAVLSLTGTLFILHRLKSIPAGLTLNATIVTVFSAYFGSIMIYMQVIVIDIQVLCIKTFLYLSLYLKIICFYFYTLTKELLEHSYSIYELFCNLFCIIAYTSALHLSSQLKTNPY